MTETKKELTTSDQLKLQLAGDYLKQVTNYFSGDKEKAMRFVTSIMQSVRKIPKLYQCDRMSLLNAFMTMAQLGLMPSDVSGEAYVIPYDNNKKIDGKFVKVLEAQFQLGYPGIVTLLYRAGNREVIAELVREHDKFSIQRGKIFHEVDPRKTKAQRGAWIGAYSIIVTATGGTIEGYMAKDDILAHAQKFSKSFNSDYSPWKEENDPEGWMPRKTVLKQTSKLAPKNEILMQALAEDNKDSIIADRLEAAKKDSEALSMGNILKHGKENQDKAGSEDQSANGPTDAEGPQDKPSAHGPIVNIG
ncbi:MAG: recombinase RecT [Candidatus Paceibacterota bacterium]|jgi:recombination protein RecT